MAGKIIADTLEHSTAGSVTTNYVVEGSAKAWMNLNGTGTIAIRDSFNISGVVDGGSGVYTANLTNSFGAVDFAVSATTGNNISFTFATAPAGTVVAGSITAYTSGSTISLADASTVSILGYGDLA